MTDLAQDPESDLTSADAILRRLTRLAIVVGRMEDAVTDYANRVLEPPGPPIIPTLSAILTEATAIQSLAMRLGGASGRVALAGVDLVGAASDDGAVRLQRVARILSRVDDRFTALSGVILREPPGPPIIPVLSTIADQTGSIVGTVTAILGRQR